MSTIQKIPKVIHYCWFGGQEKPSIVKKCMASWERYLPDYQIVEWKEDNINLEINQYVKEAYQAGKFAFVSDYVRVHALYHYGGIYLDTDVEIFKSLDPFLQHDSFWGFEQENFIATSTIGAAKGNKLIKLFLDSYEDIHFVNQDGSFNEFTNVAKITEILSNKGLVLNGELQEMNGMATFYPQTYFSPYDYINCRKFITEDTYAMHLFHKSWLPVTARIKGNMKSLASKIIGGENIAKLRKIATKA